MEFIGIDLGTSSVKLLLMAENGAVVKTVSRAYPLSMPNPGWSEQSPEDWWKQTCDGMKELMQGRRPSEVRAIGFGGQMHGLVALDGRDRVIRPAILWNDGRTGEETAYLNGAVGKDRLAAMTGNIAFAGFTAPKLLWLRKHEPDNFARIAKIMLPKDYLSYRMTGVHCTDYSDASGTLLLDVEHKVWSAEMLRLCGVPAAWLPGLRESWEVVGTLRPEAARELGLPETVKVCAGAGDNAAAAVGTGTVRGGACNLSVGTSGTVFVAEDAFVQPSNHALHSFAHATGRYHLMGCILSAASGNAWWMERILRTKEYGSEQRDFVPLGTNGVLYAPYLSGERTPYNDTAVRGAFFGLSSDTSRGQMTQAVLEGVAFAMRDSLELANRLGAGVEKATICGGGARSPVWRSIFSNVLGIPVMTIRTEEGPGLGAAMLAAVGCGAYGSVEEIADSVVRTVPAAEPDAGTHALYNEQYGRFTRMYPALKSVYAG